VFAVDQRNHGRSPHTADMSYQLMSEDLKEFLVAQHLGSVICSSFDGRKNRHGLRINLSRSDGKISRRGYAPRDYPDHHRQILKALLSLDLRSVKNRVEMESQLAPSIPDLATRQFLLKNVKRDPAELFFGNALGRNRSKL